MKKPTPCKKCSVCSKQLRSHNKSGLCSKHLQDLIYKQAREEKLKIESQNNIKMEVKN